MKGKQLHFFESETEKNSVSRRTISLPVDVVVMLSIVIILVFILIFSMGVEKGRKTAYLFAKPSGPAQENLDTTGQPEAKREVLGQQPDNTKDSSEASADVAVNVAANVAAGVGTNTGNNVSALDVNKYLIQVATFLKENTALLEAKNLEKTGYPVSISKKGKFLVILVGNFKDSQEAQNQMRTLRKKYKDCFIRRL